MLMFPCFEFVCLESQTTLASSLCHIFDTTMVQVTTTIENNILKSQLNGFSCNSETNQFAFFRLCTRLCSDVFVST